jgi:UDP-N-acetylglucosamine:LPS N-acetylglucosamine transferase
MNNGTKTLSLKIAKIIPILNELRNYNFYISTSKLQKKLLQKVKMSKNIFLINNSLRSMYNFIKNADLIIARGGYNTITECLVYKKPSILAEEKNNPEIMGNLSNIKKKNLAAIIKDHEWRPKTFKKMIDRFFKYRINFIISNLKKFRIKNNGAQDIVKDIKKELKLKKIL